MSNTQTAPRGLAVRPIQQFLLYDAIDTSPALVFIADDEMRYPSRSTTRPARSSATRVRNCFR